MIAPGGRPTDFITEAQRSDIILVWYGWVDDMYRALERPYGGWRWRGPAPIFSASEVITVALVIDTLFGEHEALGLAFLRQYESDLFSHLPANGHYNQRRTCLGPFIDQVRLVLS